MSHPAYDTLPASGPTSQPAAPLGAAADDHDVMRLGLRTLLAAAPDIEVVGEAGDGAEAIARVEALAPDVVIMDLAMGTAGADGVSATREITRRGSLTRVLVLAMHDEEAYLIPVLEAGAAGYIVKSSASTDLLTAVRTVARGGTFVRARGRPCAGRGVEAARGGG